MSLTCALPSLAHQWTPCLALPCLQKRTPYLGSASTVVRFGTAGCLGLGCSYLAFSRDCTTWDFTTVYAEQPFVSRKPGQGMLMA